MSKIQKIEINKEFIVKIKGETDTDLTKEQISETLDNLHEHLKEIICNNIVDDGVVSVEPVKRGYWIDKPYSNYPAYDIRYCSECSWNIHKSKLRNSDLNWNCCPNCGAKMNEVKLGDD